MFKLAELFVDIGTNDQGLKQGLANAKSMIGGMAGKLAMAAGAIGGGAFLYKAVQQASTLNETLNKVGVIFGASTSKVTKQAEYMARSFGLNKNEMLDAAANMGMLAQQAGFAKDAAADFANTMVKAAGHAQSFSNTQMADALHAIHSALQGNGEAISHYGVFLDEAHTEAIAAAMGFRKYGGVLKDGEKLLVRQALILRGLGAAWGDLDRTADQSMNQQKKMFGQLTNITEELGSIMLPVWDDIVRTLGGALGYIQDALANNAAAIRSWVDTSITRAQAFREAFVAIFTQGGLGTLLQNLATWSLWAADKMANAFVSMAQYAATFAESVSAYLSESGVGALFQSLGAFAMEAWEHIVIAFDGMVAAGQSFYNSFTTFLADSGVGGMFEQIGEWSVWMANQISAAFSTIFMLVRNWKSVWAIATIKIQEGFLNIVEAAQWGFDALGQLAVWFGDNWVNILQTGLNGMVTIFQNGFANIRNIAKATWDYITSMGQSGFKVEMTPLLEGFKNEIKQLPEIAGPQFTSLANLIEQETDNITAKETDRLEKPKEKAKDEEKKEEAKKKTNTSPGYQAQAPLQQARKIETMGLADFAKKLQESAFGGNLDQQQLSAMQQVAANTGRIATRPDPVARANP